MSHGRVPFQISLGNTTMLFPSLTKSVNALADTEALRCHSSKFSLFNSIAP